MTDIADAPERDAATFRTSRMLPFEYDDPFVDAQRARIEARIEELAAQGAEHFGNIPGLVRKRTSSLDHSNPATRFLVAADPTIGEWLATVPSAAALHPLYDPNTSALPNGLPVGEEMRHWIRNIADARGIRSRAKVVEHLLVSSALRTPYPSRWLSLACGAAQPVLASMRLLADQGAAIPDLTLADLDTSALELASRYASQHDLSGQIATRRRNVLARHGFAGRARWIPGLMRRSDWSGAFDAVEAIGILEYLQADDWIYTYRGLISTRRRLAGATTFLRNAYECVSPGGVLIVGNMLDGHPQLGFTLDVIQWPHIQPRPVDEMIRIIRAAGIEDHVDVYLPSDGVYAIYAITKPNER